MAFHQQIPLIIYFYAFFRIPPLYKGKGWSLLNTDHLFFIRVHLFTFATSFKGKRVVIRQHILPLSHISLESLHVLSGHLSAGPWFEGRIGCGR